MGHRSTHLDRNGVPTIGATPLSGLDQQRFTAALGLTSADADAVTIIMAAHLRLRRLRRGDHASAGEPGGSCRIREIIEARDRLLGQRSERFRTTLTGEPA